MSENPRLPKSRRNMADLDSLIADSIGKMGSYSEMHGLPKAGQKSNPSPSTEAQAPAVTESAGDTDDKPERFQISLSGAVIIAAKLEALRQKTTAGEITERALRSYLGMDPNV